MKEHLKNIGLGFAWIVGIWFLCWLTWWLLDVTPTHVLAGIGIGIMACVSVGIVLVGAWFLGRYLRYGPCQCWEDGGYAGGRVTSGRKCPVHPDGPPVLS